MVAAVNAARDEGVKLGRDEGVKLGRDEGVKLGRDEGVKLGRAAGMRESLLLLLTARGVVLTVTQRGRVDACEDAATLERWISRAITATSAEDVMA